MAQERRSADTREKILAVAEAQFAEKGYAGAHLQDMAEAVGVQKTALYYYFPSKGALYLAVLSRMLEEFDHRIGAVLSLDLPHRERLERLLDDFNDLLAERRNYSLILLRIFVDRVPVDLRPLQPTIEKTVGSILSFYRAGVESGDIEADQCDLRVLEETARRRREIGQPTAHREYDIGPGSQLVGRSPPGHADGAGCHGMVPGQGALAGLGFSHWNCVFVGKAEQCLAGQ